MSSSALLAGAWTATVRSPRSVATIVTLTEKPVAVVRLPCLTPEVRAEIEARRDALVNELWKLDGEHPWAGCYAVDEGMELILTQSGRCLATYYGCRGSYRWNIGTAMVRDGRLHIDFERPTTRGSLGDFECDYTIFGSGSNRFLRSRIDHTQLRVGLARLN